MAAIRYSPLIPKIFLRMDKCTENEVIREVISTFYLKKTLEL